MEATTDHPQCLACGQGSDTIPLVMLEYQKKRLWICPQHLPILIHNPTQLVGKLEGAEHMKPADHQD